jgi:TPR repeat protein
MGKRFPAAALAAAFRPYSRSGGSAAATAAGKASKPPNSPLDTPRNAGAGAGASSGRAEVREVAAACGMQEDERVPLSEMVLDCTRRWFQDALKEARAGDAAMQVLVGQMYRSGYGVNKNEQKVSPPFLRFRSGFVWNLELKGAAFTEGLFLNS